MKTLVTLFLTALFFHCAYAQVTNGLVAKYSFNNGTADDEIGTVDGTLNHVVPGPDRFGNAGYAMSFMEHDSSWIDIGDNFDDVLAGANSTFSFSFWVWLSAPNNANTMIMAKYGNSSCTQDQRAFSIINNSTVNSLAIVYYTQLDGNEYRQVLTQTFLEDSIWHHVVISYDGSLNGNNGLDRLKVFINNNEESTSIGLEFGTPSDMEDGNAHFSVGTSLGTQGIYCAGPVETILNGYFDDLRIYDRVLTTLEVDTLYNVAKPTVGLEELTADKALKIYPSPARTSIHIDMPYPVVVSNATISDVTGNVVHVLNEVTQEIDVQYLSSGIYFLTIQTKTGNRYTARFVKY